MITFSQIIIALLRLQGFGNKKVKAICDYSISNNYNLDCADSILYIIQKCIKQKIVKGIKEDNIPDKTDIIEALDYAAYIIKKSKDSNINVVSYIDNEFPTNLLSTVDETGKESVPLLIYYKGNLDITKKKSIAIIGTREPTPEGVMAGKLFGKKFAEAGFNVVSGLAIGCDTAGHQGAIDSACPYTTAVLAHGLDTIYPEENSRLAEEIVAKGGLLVSEYPIGTQVNRYNLVARDRLQAALADATLVIQTGTRGGTHHAANTTLIAKKPLFCVQYKGELVHHEKVEGLNLLASKGATFIGSTNAIEKISESLNTKIISRQPSLFDDM